MSTALDALVIVAVVALVLVRQFKPQRVSGAGRRWLVLPVILVAVALREPGLLDAHDRSLSLLLLVSELLVGLLIGAGWAWTGRLWTEQDGSVWTRGTMATAGVWIAGIALRLGIMGVGALVGVHQGTGALLLALATSVLVRRGTLILRARTAGSSYGDAVPVGPWKDRV